MCAHPGVVGGEVEGGNVCVFTQVGGGGGRGGDASVLTQDCWNGQG